VQSNNKPLVHSLHNLELYTQKSDTPVATATDSLSLTLMKCRSQTVRGVTTCILIQKLIVLLGYKSSVDMECASVQNVFNLFIIMFSNPHGQLELVYLVIVLFSKKKNQRCIFHLSFVAWLQKWWDGLGIQALMLLHDYGILKPHHINLSNHFSQFLAIFLVFPYHPHFFLLWENYWFSFLSVCVSEH
jgi:hypothetical protein